jgi:Bacterial Ig domain
VYNHFQKIRHKLANRRKESALVGLLALLVIVLPLAVYIAKQQVERYLQASGSTPVITVTLPATANTCSTRFSSQEVWNTITSLVPPGGGYPPVYQRVDSSNLDVWRVQGTDGYSNSSTSLVEPSNYTNSNNGNVINAWSFTTIDKQLSTGPTGSPREVDMIFPPDALWTGTAPLGGNGSAQGTIADQTYGQLANYEANLVRYFRTGILVTNAGGTVTYTATSLTDTAKDFTSYGNSGYAVTATVMDANGFPDWVSATVTSVTNSGHTLNFSGGWSSANSGGGTLPSTTPALGAAYNLASVTPPITSPQSATPWPLPPSVGNVQYFELFNEPDMSNSNYPRLSPPLLAPVPTLTGMNVAGGTLTPGTTYSYRITAVNVGTAESLPGTEVSITLPAGDNAVQINWAATTNLGLSPFAYRIYGRSSGAEQAMVVVGRDASTGLTWTDTGSVSPSGSMPTSDSTPNYQVWRGHEYTRMWNVVAPAMKAVDPTIKITGPTTTNPVSLATLDVDTKVVSTGPNDTSWKSNADYIPVLMAGANPQPDTVTIHNYGYWGGTTDTDAQQWGGISYGISNFLSQDAPVLGSTPVFLDETNIDAGSFGNPPAPDLRAETQMGAAWLADEYIQVCQRAPQFKELFQEQDYNGDLSWGFMSGASYAGSTTCIPQPNCANVRASQPNLEYWLMKKMDSLLQPGSNVVPVSGVPPGFDAFAVQAPNSSTVTVVVVNKQINTTNDAGGKTAGTTSGLGVPGTVQISLSGATSSDTQETNIDQNTDLLNGPATSDLGAQNTVSLNMNGYGVTLLNFTATGIAPTNTPAPTPTPIPGVRWVQGKYTSPAGATATPSVTLSNVQSGDVLVVDFTVGAGWTETSSNAVTSTGPSSLSWTQATSITHGQTQVNVWYAVVPSGGSGSYTIIGTAAASTADGIVVDEYSGIDGIDPVLTSGTNGGNSTTPTAGSSTSIPAGALIYGAMSWDSGAETVTAGSGFTQREAFSNPSSNQPLNTADETVSTSTSNPLASWSLSSSTSWTAVMLALNPVAIPTGAPSSTPTPSSLPTATPLPTATSTPLPTPTTAPLPTNTPTPQPSPTPTPVGPTPTPTPPDTTPPTVTITSPLNGATVKHSTIVTITATDSDNVGVTQVQFLLNGTLLCTSNSPSSPTSCKWNVPGKKGVTYTLTARAYDAAGNASSNSIQVKSQ